MCHMPSLQPEPGLVRHLWPSLAPQRQQSPAADAPPCLVQYAEAAGLARALAEAEAGADGAAREAGTLRRRCGDLEAHAATLHVQFLAAREEAADLRARCRWCAGFPAAAASVSSFCCDVGDNGSCTVIWLHRQTGKVLQLGHGHFSFGMQAAGAVRPGCLRRRGTRSQPPAACYAAGCAVWSGQRPQHQQPGAIRGGCLPSANGTVVDAQPP